MRDTGAHEVQWPCLSFLELLNKQAQTGWPQITGIHSLMVLEVRSLKSRCGRPALPPKALGEHASWPLPASGGGITPVFVAMHGCLLRVSLSVSSPHLIRMPVLGFRAHPNRSPLGGSVVKNPLPMPEMRVQFRSWEDPLEKGMAVYSSTLAWEISWSEEPGRLHAVHWVGKESDTTEHLSTNLV